ncbi:unnamed protein product [Vitrella brassicaformis CCMP3155]|uniref:Uncharacterized protein n=1 Tax=Vitrella brassicaformis (strain CCMP3155) TaxID=1169540 RepID=A0A0G4EKW4_VITBC|nr:unnamed protein product [Vitrella brassicaformis CCMP3155]|eukprot:CEL97491.1 unnamed protein product [Vitrella brassicaformis CCMP3155]
MPPPDTAGTDSAHGSTMGKRHYGVGTYTSGMIHKGLETANTRQNLQNYFGKGKRQVPYHLAAGQVDTTRVLPVERPKGHEQPFLGSQNVQWTLTTPDNTCTRQKTIAKFDERKYEQATKKHPRCPYPPYNVVPAGADFTTTAHKLHASIAPKANWALSATGEPREVRPPLDPVAQGEETRVTFKDDKCSNSPHGNEKAMGMTGYMDPATMKRQRGPEMENTNTMSGYPSVPAGMYGYRDQVLRMQDTRVGDTMRRPSGCPPQLEFKDTKQDLGTMEQLGYTLPPDTQMHYHQHAPRYDQTPQRPGYGTGGRGFPAGMYGFREKIYTAQDTNVGNCMYHRGPSEPLDHHQHHHEHHHHQQNHQQQPYVHPVQETHHEHHHEHQHQHQHLHPQETAVMQTIHEHQEAPPAVETATGTGGGYASIGQANNIKTNQLPPRPQTAIGTEYKHHPGMAPAGIAIHSGHTKDFIAPSAHVIKGFNRFNTRDSMMGYFGRGKRGGDPMECYMPEVVHIPDYPPGEWKPVEAPSKENAYRFRARQRHKDAGEETPANDVFLLSHSQPAGIVARRDNIDECIRPTVGLHAGSITQTSPYAYASIHGDPSWGQNKQSGKARTTGYGGCAGLASMPMPPEAAQGRPPQDD